MTGVGWGVEGQPEGVKGGGQKLQMWTLVG